MVWSEIRELLAARRDQTTALVMATLVRSRGSSYRQPGARMFVAPDLRFWGRISAGCLEEEIVDAAQVMFAHRESRLLSFDLRPRFGCAGQIDVLLERIGYDHEFLLALAESLASRRSFLVVAEYAGEDQTRGTRVLTGLTTLPAQGVLIEQIDPPQRLAIVGEHDDADALRQLGNFLGWEVIMANAALPEPDRHTCLVVMSHHFGRDAAALEEAWRHQFSHVALIGGVKRKEQLRHALLELGVSLDWLENVYAPAGLDIGAESPREIALAIIAEIMKVVSGRDARSLRNRCQAIHLRCREVWG